MGTSCETTQEPNDGTFYGRPGDVDQLTNTLNLLLQVTQDFIVNSTSGKFSEQYSG